MLALIGVFINCIKERIWVKLVLNLKNKCVVARWNY